MSTEKKITRHSIGTGETQPFFFLGLVSAEPDYRLSVMINRHLGTDLRKSNEDLVISSPAGIQSFTRFYPLNRAFALISNRCGRIVLLRKLKNIDFILVPGADQDRNEAERFAASLRLIPEITAVFLLDSRDNPDRNLPLLTL